MSLLLFNLKQILKRKSNFFVVLLAFVVVFFFFVSGFMRLNMEIGEQSSSYKSDVATLKKDVDTLNQMLMKSTSQDERDVLNSDLNTAKEKIKYLKEKQEAFENQDWKTYYFYQEKLNGILIKASQYDSNKYFYDEQLDNVLSMNQAYFQYKQMKDPTLDSRFACAQAVPFFMASLDGYLFVLILCILIFIGSKYFESKIKNGLDIESGLPFLSIKRYIFTMLPLIVCSMGILAFLFIFICIVSLFTYGTGSFLSPVAIFDLKGFLNYVPFSSIFFKLVCLSMLGILFVVNVSYLVIKICKKSTSGFIVSLMIVIVPTILITQLAPLYGIAQYIPFTYLNVVKVVTEEMSFLLNNGMINIFNGIVMLSLSNIFLMLALMMDKRKRI